MPEALKEYIEKESGLQVASVIENRAKVLQSFMRQIVTINRTTYCIRMTHLMDGRLDVFYYKKTKLEHSMEGITE